MATLRWITSSSCDSAGIACVEVALVSGSEPGVRVRDSTDPYGPVLAFGPAAWTEFLGAVGELRARADQVARLGR